MDTITSPTRLPPPDPAPALSGAEKTRADRLEMLAGDLADLATLAAAHAKSLYATPTPDLARPDLVRIDTATTILARCARALRQTIALQSLLEQRAAQSAAAARLRDCRRTTARTEILRVTEDCIVQAADHRVRENMFAELHERLSDPVLDDEILIRKAADIARDICRDMGVHCGMGTLGAIRSPGHAVALHARAAAPTPRSPAPRPACPVPPPSGPPLSG